jgi:hypothetical protein
MKNDEFEMNDLKERLPERVSALAEAVLQFIAVTERAEREDKE